MFEKLGFNNFEMGRQIMKSYGTCLCGHIDITKKITSSTSYNLVKCYQQHYFQRTQCSVNIN